MKRILLLKASESSRPEAEVAKLGFRYFSGAVAKAERGADMVIVCSSAGFAVIKNICGPCCSGPLADLSQFLLA